MLREDSWKQPPCMSPLTIFWLTLWIGWKRLCLKHATYHINPGYLHGAFLTFRRALALAQLINVPRLAERPGTREEFV